MQGHFAATAPHAVNSRHWSSVLWRPSSSLLSGRFLWFGSFHLWRGNRKKKEKEKGKKKVSVCTSAPWLCQYDNGKKRKMWLFCLSQLFISTYCSRLWGVCCFFLKDLWLNRVKQSLMPEVITLQTHGLVVYLGLYAQKHQILPTFLLQCFSLFSSQPFTHSK